MANHIGIILIAFALFLFLAVGLAVGLYFAFRNNGPLGGTGPNNGTATANPAVRIYTIPAGQNLTLQSAQSSYGFTSAYQFTVTLPGSVSNPPRVIQVYTNASSAGLGRIPAANEVNNVNNGIGVFLYSVSGTSLTVYYPIADFVKSINNALVSNNTTLFPLEILYI